jgi:hypothetical protein
MRKALSKRKDELTLRTIDGLGDEMDLHREPALVKQWRAKLAHSSNLDIREGTVFGSTYQGTCGWIGQIPSTFLPADLFRARRYVEGRIPGLPALFESTLNPVDA